MTAFDVLGEFVACADAASPRMTETTDVVLPFRTEQCSVTLTGGSRRLFA